MSVSLSTCNSCPLLVLDIHHGTRSPGTFSLSGYVNRVLICATHKSEDNAHTPYPGCDDCALPGYLTPSSPICTSAFRASHRDGLGTCFNRYPRVNLQMISLAHHIQCAFLCRVVRCHFTSYSDGYIQNCRESRCHLKSYSDYVSKLGWYY